MGESGRIHVVLRLLIASSILTLVKCHSQEVVTRLVAPWSPTTTIHEAAEYVADVHPQLYWSFVDALFDRIDPSLISETFEADRNLASVIAYNYISASKLRMMDWSLTSRAYSPKVLSYQRLINTRPESCKDAFVLIRGKTLCDTDDITSNLKFSLENSDLLMPNDVVIEEDHKYPSPIWTSDKTYTVAILYGNLKSPQTKKLHQLLKKWTDKVGYILRPLEHVSTPDNKMLLSGYGVELQFKSQEYKAQDDSDSSAAEKNQTTEVGGFLFDKLQELHPSKIDDLHNFQNALAMAISRGAKAEFEALKAWQIQELGLQASYFSTTSSDGTDSTGQDMLNTLADLSGNFPSRAASLSSMRVPDSFKRSIAHNQRLLGSHFNIDEGEGAFFLQGAYVDPDSLDVFTFMKALRNELEFMELLKSLRNDASDLRRMEIDRILSLGTKSMAEPDLALDIRDSSIFWINDLEKDEEYEDWPDDLSQLFFRMGGIMLRPVRRNVFNLVITLDPLDTPNVAGLLKMAQSFMAHKSPVRIGIVFCNKHPTSGNHLSLLQRAMNFAVTEGKTREIFNDIVMAFMTENFEKFEKKWSKDAGDEYDFGSQLACDFVSRTGRATPGAFLNGVPLKWDSVEDFEEVVLNQLLREAQIVQSEAYSGKINDDTDIFEHLMSKPHVLTRLNDKILDISQSKFVTFGTESWTGLEKTFRDPLANVATKLDYLEPSGKRKSPVSVSVWVFADLNDSIGRKFLLNAMNFLDESAVQTRVAFISTSEKNSKFTQTVLDSFTTGDLKTILRILAETSELSKETYENEIGKLFTRAVGVKSGSRGIIVNGRMIGPLEDSETFELGDWALVQKYSYDSCAKHVEGPDWNPNSIMRLCAAIGMASTRKSVKRFVLPEFQNSFPVGKKKEQNENDVFYVDLTAVIDPSSRHAHKMTVLLKAVEEKVGEWVRSRVVFNPPSKHSELPLKSYFRYVAGTDPDETVSFTEIPREPLFTQNIYAPENWMVEVVKCDKDLDNVRLRDLGDESVESEYELEYLLVEGHCLETKTGSPPRGLQFVLVPHNSDVKSSETIVMANLGYFQLKASPGLWSLVLRDGPSKEIFSLEKGSELSVSVNSFDSVVLKVKVRRNPGKEAASLLDTEDSESTSWFGFGSKKQEKEDEVLNIFSVASGHLYERLLRIMMLSVLKQTKSKVKFWFLKNYLSPTLKDVLPEMAKEYGFEYELVQYHWPRWLNPQREKQRIIWGYKILFLDVLFPLSLKKIVFVDADQVVRTDMKELFELDLEGNPYGYTPFCDSRTEMEGFRFWKHGYWKSHLGRRKYHISALYVVDLQRFRRFAAGDRLRGQYQALSQDPNSLSNLDQDLPNNMIHQVGIKSLPQEWLWCETWCDDASKKYAKTIDLCNNPLTKEPKLEAAQRILPEWKDYDQEIKLFMQRLSSKKSATQEKPSESQDSSKTHSDHNEL